MSEDINVNALAEAINDKMDRDGNNIESPKLPIFLIDVQYPTAENSYTWYRLYSDGWVEQGGLAIYDSNPKIINLPITMADDNYTAQAIQQRNQDAGAVWTQINIKTTTTLKVGGYYASGSVGAVDSSRNFNWQVSGMAA